MTSTGTARIRDKPLVRKLTGLYQRTRQARWAMISQVVTSGANFATTVILVRALGLEDFGRFSICFLLTMIVRNFLNGIVLMPMSTIAPKLHGISTPAYRGFLALNVFAFGIGSSALLAAIAVPLGGLINAPWLADIMLPLAIANLTAVFADYMRRYHFVYEAPAAACGVDTVRFAFQLALLVAFAYLWTGTMTPASALYALAGGAIAGAAFGLLFHGGVKWSNRLAASVWPRHWNFIKWMTPGYALDAVQHNAPLFLGSAILGESALGLVRAMQQLANALNLPLNALQQIAPSLAASSYKKGGHAALKKFLFVMTGSSVAFVMVCAALTFLLSHIVVGILFKVPVAEANPILFTYFVVNILILIRLPLIIKMQSIEKPAHITASSTIGSMTAILFSFVFIHFYNSKGIPLAAIAALMANIIYYYFLSIRTRLKN